MRDENDTLAKRLAEELARLEGMFYNQEELERMEFSPWLAKLITHPGSRALH